MGQEITSSQFTAEDFEEFAERLSQETRLLEHWLDAGVFTDTGHVAGFELEAWLVDHRARPAPVNEPVLEKLADPLVVPELALFNLELNGTPQPLMGAALTDLAEELRATWKRCNAAAAELDARLAMMGILPTVEEGDLTLENMSSMQRYRALDEQLTQLRGGLPLHLELSGRERISVNHENVMLESATTSFQIHLKVDTEQAGRFYNAAKIISGPMVAVSANSPYLFGAELWDETRIPLFEQAVQAGDAEEIRRVTLGVGYVDSILDCFRANLERYPVLLPELMDEPEQLLPHLRLHNGTIWRWNRPLVGFGDRGVPHIRIEHRVVPAGPTVDDSIANAAFYFGCVRALSGMASPPERRLPFSRARNNFYQAARHGLDAELEWLDGTRGGAVTLLRQQLLPLAAEGLERLGIDPDEAAHWLGIITRRLETGRNGAVWQRAWVNRHGRDMAALTEAYMERQESGRLVHEWTL